MSKEYTIQEVFKFPVGTKFKTVRKEEVVEIDGDENCKILVFLSGRQCLSLSTAWLNEKFTLIRKELTFFEAMRLADEGKVVESGGCKYKKIDNKLKYTTSNNDWLCGGLNSNEIKGKWYEVEGE